MSGIVGFFTSSECIDRLQIVKSMLTSIKHRGVDVCGAYISKIVGLGSIRRHIDSDEPQKTLISNKTKTLWIIWNGKIFNRIELEDKHLKSRRNFKSCSDGELMLHLFEEYGVDCLNMINGQFAFAIWDTIKKELLLARDRIGICPLYYSKLDNDIVFASEIKAVLQYPTITSRISSKSLTQIVTFWTTITPDTIFEGIYELPPGHYLIFQKNNLEINTYWTFPVFKPHEYSKLSLADSIEQFDVVFNDAVKIRTQSDKSFGAYLSGGIDSSINIAYIKKEHPDLDLDTFSIGFTDQKFDESFYQKLIVDRFDTNHTKLYCNDNDILDNFEQTVWHAETTLLRTGAVPMFLLSQLTSENNVTSILSGEGADEILGGYNIFKEAIVREFWAKDKSSKYRPLLLKKLYPYLSQMETGSNLALKMFFGYKLTETSSPIYSHLLRWHNTSRIKNYFSFELKNEIKHYNPVEEFTDKLSSKLEGVDLLSRAQWIESNTFMTNYLLSSQGERMTMANSVEGRYPFLDHRVIELCMKLKPEYRLNGLNEKHLLKSMMKNKLPNEIINRKKQPYRAPVVSSLFSDASSHLINNILSKEKIDSAGLFDYNRVSQLKEKMKLSHQITEIDNMALTAILSTQILHSYFVEKSIPTFVNMESVMLDNIVYD